LEGLDLVTLVSFGLARLARATDLIAHFIEEEVEFQRALLWEKPNAALNSLLRLRERCGVSFWAVNRELAVRQLALGIEEQKLLVSTIRSEGPRFGPLKYLAHYWSERAEPAVTFARFASSVESRVRQHHLAPDVAAFIRFHLLAAIPTTYEDVLAVVKFSVSGPAIDLFLALRSLFLFVQTPEVVQELVGAVEAAPKMPRDHSVWQFLLGEPAAFEALNMKASPRAKLGRPGVHLERPPAGSYRAADWFRLALIASGSEPLPNGPAPESLGFTVLKTFNEFYRERGRIRETASAIRKLSGQFAGMEWTYGCEAALASLYSNHHPPWRLAEFAKLSRLSHRDPEICALAEADAVLRDQGLREACRDPRLQVRLSWIPRLTDPHFLPSDPPIPATLVTQAQVIASSATADALGLRLSEIDHRIPEYGALRLAWIRLCCFAAVQKGDLARLSRLVVTTYLEDVSASGYFPIPEIEQYLSPAVLRHHFGAVDLDLCTFLDLLVEATSKRRESDLAVAVELFLESLGALNSPKTDWLGTLGVTPKSVHFLRNTCRESVLNQIRGLPSSLAVLEFRRAIVDHLALVDPSRAEEYRREAHQLSRRLLLSRRTREIESSKIFVDTEGIKKVMLVELEDLYERYRTYLVTSKSDDTTVAPAEPAKERALPSVSEIMSLKLPDDEAKELLVQILERVRDEYLYGEDHGLDRYLSVRVRHGTLLRHVRKPLEAERLLISKQTNASIFLPNSYWGTALAAVEQSILGEIYKRLLKFSDDFDKGVREIIGGWIQVATKKSGNAAFVFSLPEPLVAAAASMFTEVGSLEEFLDRVLLEFGAILDVQLGSLRSRLESEAKPRFEELLNSLRRDIQRLAPRGEVAALVAAIDRARVELANALGRAIQWFRRAPAAVREPLPMHEAAELAADLARLSLPNLEVDLRVEGFENAEFDGAVLITLVDLCFLFLENADKHSNVTSPRVSLQFTRSEDLLVIRAENLANLRDDLPSIQAKLESLLAELTSGGPISGVNREGGSGLRKAAKIVKSAFGERSSIDFGISAEARFFVECRLPWAAAGVTEHRSEDSDC